MENKDNFILKVTHMPVLFIVMKIGNVDVSSHPCLKVGTSNEAKGRKSNACGTSSDQGWDGRASG